MHNRVRMITASFLTKDLHVWWPVGAQHFLDHLVDGDIASNNHGWQWVAGTGTDASPYFRVFNPVTQGRKFDPDGDYVRRWVPELAHLPGAAAHEPWKHDNGYDQDYPRPVVDHDDERKETLARYERRDAEDQPRLARREHVRGPVDRAARLRQRRAASRRSTATTATRPSALPAPSVVVAAHLRRRDRSVLAWALRITPGDPLFYVATLALAAVWLVGALLSGPAARRQGPHPRRASERPGRSCSPSRSARCCSSLFLVGALVVARIPVLREPVDQLLDHARFGSLPAVLAITLVNGVVEELYFRGALYAALPRHAVDPDDRALRPDHRRQRHPAARPRGRRHRPRDRAAAPRHRAASSGRSSRTCRGRPGCSCSSHPPSS